MIAAAKEENGETLKMLLKEAGVMENLSLPLEVFGESSLPLQAACTNGSVISVEYLMLHPTVDVNAKDANNSTALICAAEEGHANVVELLLRNTLLDVNAVDDDGCTALWKAAAHGHVNVVQWMVALRADHLEPSYDLQGMDENGDYFTPYDIATKNKFDKISQILREFRTIKAQSVRNVRAQLQNQIPKSHLKDVFRIKGCPFSLFFSFFCSCFNCLSFPLRL